MTDAALPLPLDVQPAQEKKQRMSGAAATLAMHALLLIAVLLWKLHYEAPQPPADAGGGILVNFGDSETGSGTDIPQSKTIAPPTPSKTETAPPVKSHDVLTQDNEAAPVINVNKKKETKKPNEVKPTSTKTNNTATKPVEAPKPKALFPGTHDNGVTSEGNTGGSGDQGRLNGSPFTHGNSDQNGSGNGIGPGDGGVGLNMTGRKILRYPSVTDNSQKTGKVAVRIKVDKTGKVVSAKATQQGSTTNDTYLYALAEKAAYQTVINASDKIEDFGTMTFTFKVK